MNMGYHGDLELNAFQAFAYGIFKLFYRIALLRVLKDLGDLKESSSHL
jgi:hypothetical protein